MNESPTPTTSTYPKSFVTYLPNITIVGQEKAIFEWHADNTITLHAANEEYQPGRLIFEAPLASIQKVRTGLALMTLTIGGKKYRVQFSKIPGALNALGGSADLLMSAAVKYSGVVPWIEKFKASSVPIKNVSVARIYIIAGIILAVIIIAFVIYYNIWEANNYTP